MEIKHLCFLTFVYLLFIQLHNIIKIFFLHNIGFSTFILRQTKILYYVGRLGFHLLAAHIVRIWPVYNRLKEGQGLDGS